MTTELIRKYINLFEKQIINEAIDYSGMFNSLYKATDTMPRKEVLKNNIDANIIWAKKILKKNDRIVWYLNWYRTKIIRNLIPQSSDDIIQKLKKLALKLKINIEIDNKYTYLISELKGQLEHLMSLTNVYKIQNYVWNKNTPVDELVDKLLIYEDEWQDDTESTVEIQDGDREIIKLSNQSWWLLDRTICSEEGEAMGHCGNAGSPHRGDKILSFRTHITNNLWKPHLTFILSDAGFIGESKGRNNTKPAEKYHRAIIALLKNNIIKGITGGGYLPEENFEMSDLPSNVREELYKLKPGLAPLDVMYNNSDSGDYSNVIYKIEMMLKNSDIEYIGYNNSSKLFYIEEWKNVDEFIREHGNSTVIYAWDSYIGNEIIDMYNSNDVTTSEVNDFIDDMPANIKNKFIDRLKKDQPESYENPEHDIYTTAEHDDDLYSLLRLSITIGYEIGVSNDMYKDMVNAINNPEQGATVIDGNLYDGKIYFAYSLHELVYMLSDEERWSEIQESEDIVDIEGNGQLINLKEPHYGWQGYDKDAAYEYFSEEL